MGRKFQEVAKVWAEAWKQVSLGHIFGLAWTTCFCSPGGSDGKASACNAGDPGSIPGSGRSPGEGNGNPLQQSCLENPMDGGAWWATVHGVAKGWTRLSNFTFTFKQRKAYTIAWENKKQKQNGTNCQVFSILMEWAEHRRAPTKQLMIRTRETDTQRLVHTLELFYKYYNYYQTKS